MKQIGNNIRKVSDVFNEWNKNNQHTFLNFIRNESMGKCIETENRIACNSISDFYVKLKYNSPDLLGFCFISSDKKTVYFSSFSENANAFKNINMMDYPVEISDFKFTNNGIFVNSKRDILVYSFFLSNYQKNKNVVALFFVSLKSFVQRLSMTSSISISSDCFTVIDDESNLIGIIFGNPNIGIYEYQIKGDSKSIFTESGNKLYTLMVDSDSGKIIILTNSNGLIIGELVNKKILEFSSLHTIFFVFIIFLTLFLCVFLLLNIKQDEVFLIEKQIKTIQVDFLKNLMELNNDIHYADFNTFIMETNKKIKNTLPKKVINRYSYEIDLILKKNWDVLYTKVLFNDDEVKMGKIEELEVIDDEKMKCTDIDDKRLDTTISTDLPIKLELTNIDFSDLDTTDNNTSESNQIETTNMDYLKNYTPYIPNIFTTTNTSKILYELEPIDKNIDNDDIIINNNGVFLIKPKFTTEPKNKEFKKLVDSVLRKA